MRVIHDYPPIFDEIDARFKIGRKPVIFAWGNIIFNPQRIHIPEYVHRHEAVHGRRQAGDVVGWWRRYIDEAEFRLAEEIPAHQAEYRGRLEEAVNRQQRRAVLKETARRLAGPLYGGMISRAKAMEILKATC